MMRLRRGLMKSEHGATAVEFALVFPLFLAFVLAIMDVSIYYFVAGQLQHGTVQAADFKRIRSQQCEVYACDGYRQKFGW